MPWTHHHACSDSSVCCVLCVPWAQVLNIADFLHNNPKHPLCAKAYMRRSMAYRSLGQYERAVEDITAALEIQPGDKELMQIKSKVRPCQSGGGQVSAALACCLSSQAAEVQMMLRLQPTPCA